MINWLENHLFTCLFKAHLGMECPGCGTQRALIALLKGDFTESLKYHAGLIPFLATLLALIIQLIVKHEKGGRVVMWLFIFTTSVTFIQYIVRQIILFT
jgi:hypothetical protein